MRKIKCHYLQNVNAPHSEFEANEVREVIIRKQREDVNPQILKQLEIYVHVPALSGGGKSSYSTLYL